MMAIVASNLFSLGNIWTEYVHPRASSEEQAHVSKITSLFIKLGAVLFVVVAPTTYVVNFQLAGGVWMLQVLPAVLLALFLTWLNGRAAVAGWVVGMAIGTWLLLLVHFKTTSYSVDLFGRHVLIYIGILAVLANIVVALLGSAIGAAARRRTAASLSPLRP